MASKWSIDWKVLVDGKDVTSKLKPVLISIDVEDKDGTASDTCAIVIDDSNAKTALPNDGGLLAVFIEGAEVFVGIIDKVRSKGNRSGGRQISVSAKGFDSKGKVKDGQRWHKDDATLKDALSNAAKKAGVSIKVDPKLASIKRDYWSPDGASFLGYGQMLARELHATFKIRKGTEAVFVPRGSAMLPPVTGIVGQNVISWDIEPVTGRPQYKKGIVEWFDRKKAKYDKEELEIGSQKAKATNYIRSRAQDKDQAKENLKGRKSEAERKSGSGSVKLDITPHGKAEAPFIMAGARPGVDGTYRISSVKHHADRGGGSTTSLQIKQPQGK